MTLHKAPKLGRLALLLVMSLSLVALAQPKPSDEAEVVAAVAPIFPAIAAAAKAKGDVIVEVKINSTGAVNSSMAVEGHPLLRKVCEVAARRWKFSRSNEENKERMVRLTFSFVLLETTAPEIETSPIFMPPYKVVLTHDKPVIETTTVH